MSEIEARLEAIRLGRLQQERTEADRARADEAARRAAAEKGSVLVAEFLDHVARLGLAPEHSYRAYEKRGREEDKVECWVLGLVLGPTPGSMARTHRHPEPGAFVHPENLMTIDHAYAIARSGHRLVASYEHVSRWKPFTGGPGMFGSVAHFDKRSLWSLRSEPVSASHTIKRDYYDEGEPSTLSVADAMAEYIDRRSS